MPTMPIDALCPNCEALPKAEEPLMPAWAALLTRPAPEAGAALADLLGLPPGPAADRLRQAHQVTLHVPRDPSRRHALRRRTLAVALPGEAWLIFRGNEHSLPFDWPPDYRTPLARLGLVAFGAEDEIFVDAGSEARAIARRLEAAGRVPPPRLRPFYTDGKRHYSCWLDGDFTRSWAFDRDDGTLREESEGGLAGWLSVQLGR